MGWRLTGISYGRVRLSWFSLEIKHIFIGLNVYIFIK